MNHQVHFRLCLPLGACLVVLAIAAGPARGADESLEGTLSGIVINPAGEPVVGARVWRWDPVGKPTDETRTDAQGRFHLGPIEAAYRPHASLLIDADGYARHDIPGESYSIFPGADNDLGTIRLDHGRVFTGRVFDAGGEPRAGVMVECEVRRHCLGHTVASIGPKWTVETDSEGRYRTPPMPVGDLSVSVKVPDRQAAHASRSVLPDGEEEIEPIRLNKDAPISGVVTDERGEPIAGVTITTYYGYEPVVTDASGAFTIHGFGSEAEFPMQARKDGYVPIRGHVEVSGAKISWRRNDLDEPEETTTIRSVGKLAVTMQRASWIEGLAVDAETGKPIPLAQVVLCFFERKPDGEIVLNGCRSSGFEQPEPGRFRISYYSPDEYHLTLKAKGYYDAEAFTPKVDQLRPIEGITIEMRPKRVGSTADTPGQHILGNVTRDGQPVKTGWIGLWALPRTPDMVNAYIQRGRTVTGDPIIYASAPIQNGAYKLDVPFQDKDWYAVVEEPGRAPTQVGPIAIELGEQKQLDINGIAGGGITGRVANVPEQWAGCLWIVAFNDTGIRAETRVKPDGSFALRLLPPGRYGLKVGHDAYKDTEVPQGHLRDIPPEAWEQRAEPWKRASVVTVKTGQETSGVVLELPR